MSDKPVQWLGSSRSDVLEHRVLYVARFVEAIYVLHAFEKRTRRTPKRDLEVGRQRFRALVSQRSTARLTGG